ncbi:MAG: Fe-S cluster assembly protein SufD [Chitinophagaceae bacterium]
MIDQPEIYPPHQLFLQDMESIVLKDENSQPGGQRLKAFEAFKRMGIPSSKTEAFKYSNFQPLFKAPFSFPTSDQGLDEEVDLSPYLIAPGMPYLVMVNGVLNKGLSCFQDLPDEVFIGSLGEEEYLNHLGKGYSPVELDEKIDHFTALNLSLSQKTLLIHIPDHVFLKEAIQILHISTGKAHLLSSPKIKIIVGQHSQLKLLESFHTQDSGNQSFTNSLTEWMVCRNARVEYFILENADPDYRQVHTARVHQCTESYFSGYTFTFGGEMVRNNMTLFLDEADCEAHLFGFYGMTGSQQVDNHTIVDHRKPNCRSNEIYKGILNDRSTGVFNGKIIVRPDAQKTNAYQSSKSILLSDEASINTKPELEIYADDVKCSHGTATGQLDREALFYLEARGISRLSAQKLLLKAFAEDIMGLVSFPGLKGHLEKIMLQQLKFN